MKEIIFFILGVLTMNNIICFIKINNIVKSQKETEDYEI